MAFNPNCESCARTQIHRYSNDRCRQVDTANPIQSDRDEQFQPFRRKWSTSSIDRS